MEKDGSIKIYKEALDKMSVTDAPEFRDASRRRDFGHKQELTSSAAPFGRCLFFTTNQHFPPAEPTVDQIIC